MGVLMRSKITKGLIPLAVGAGMIAAAAWPAAAGAATAPTVREAAAAAYWVGLNDVACASAKLCFATGYVSYGTSDIKNPLVERWNGQKWSLGTAALPAGAAQGSFNAVTCRAATDCVAVGQYSTATGASLPLAEFWHGKAWASVKLPTTAAEAKSGLELTAVSCASATSCDIIGLSYATYTPVAYTWNGKKFAQVALPAPAKGVSFAISGVSCRSASRCVAVGGYDLNTGWLAEIWNGKAWKAVKLSSAGQRGELLAVSCVTSTHCFATGDRRTAAGYRSYADVLNGATWKVTALTPAATGDEYLDAVTCASATDCLATGATEAEVPYALSGIAYAEAWNGKAWTVKKVPTLPGAKGPGTAEGSSLDSATCVTASYCLAVGTAGVHLQGVSGVWTGKAWNQLSVAAS
jgi:hypothetical protein